MFDYIALSLLNDFIFCPYSIYLHNVYMGGSEDIVYATPQVVGKASHSAIDNKTYSSRKNDIVGLSVFSVEFGISGKIDIYKSQEKLLIERKHKISTIYQGQIYQLWGQYFCMTEMNYEIEKLAFYSMATNTTFSINIPTSDEKNEFINFIETFKQFDPETSQFIINENKCKHCIYCNLCDKIEVENVYS